MHTHRFGRRLKLPATIAIKHQIRKLMLQALIKEADAIARAEAIAPSSIEEPRFPDQLKSSEVYLGQLGARMRKS